MVPFCKTFLFISFFFTLASTTVTMKRMKFILIWTIDTPSYSGDRNVIRSGDEDLGQQMFKMSNCPHQNCYITDDKHFFGAGKVEKFDAILFNGKEINAIKNKSYLPQKRLLHQKYIFVWAEPVCHNVTDMDCSVTNFPICPEIFENFFNWAATYKKDSHIPFSVNENSLRQKLYMACEDNMSYMTIPDLKQKNKAVVWFVSNCTNRAKQLEYAISLRKSLEVYGQTLDIYGCGELSPKDNSTEIDMLRNEYFFYLDFIDSLEENAVNTTCPFARNSVPIVYGYDNYSRFMPVGTFIDAIKYMPEVLATTITFFINKLDIYEGFFTFRDYEALYVAPNARAYHCQLCAALNNEKMMANNERIDGFRWWWHNQYEKWCKHWVTVEPKTKT